MHRTAPCRTSCPWEWVLRSSLTALVLLLLLAVGATPATAEVFASKQEALAAAFPDADRIDHRSEILDDAEAEWVEQLARSVLESRLVTLYTAWKDGRVQGYAFIEVHTVRTMPEAFLVVLTPEGRVRSVRMLAFYEPPEYRPPDRWLALFEALDADRLQPAKKIGGEIHGIAGSTLTARAVSGGIRRSLAFYQLLVSSGRSGIAAHEAGLPPAIGSGGR